MILLRKSLFRALMTIVGCWVVFSTRCCRGKWEAISWKKLKGIGSLLRSLCHTRFFVFSLLLLFFSEVPVHALDRLHLVVLLEIPWIHSFFFLFIFWVSVFSFEFWFFWLFVWLLGKQRKMEGKEKRRSGVCVFSFCGFQKVKILLKSAKRLCSEA